MPFRAAMLIAALLAAGPALGQPRPSESVRVATFNTYLLSPLFKCFNAILPECLAQVAGQTEQWAERLADTILADAGRFDIIALNEVWDEDAKDILVRRLRRTFPVYIKDIDADLLTLSVKAKAEADRISASIGVEVKGEDSGLMLFARRSFAPEALPDPRHRWDPSRGDLDATTPEVAFTLYESCGSEDCLSAKGAAYVRLRHESGRMFNIILTHMQADYPKKGEFFPGERKDQFEAIRRMMVETLAPLGTPEQLMARGERFLVMGDLNVAPLTSGLAEWTDLFDNPGSFWTDPMHDAWARTQPLRASNVTADPGITHEKDDERLDYILSAPRPADGTVRRLDVLCLQHMTIPVDFRDLDSDHWMVHADTNRDAPHCHPRIAHRLDLGKPGDVDTAAGQDVTGIVYGGGMQWFEAETDGAGTYTIARLGLLPTEVTIYDPADMTRPISRYNQTTFTFNLGDGAVLIDQYVLPPRFFIRVAATDRTATGDYRLFVRRHTCASQADACILQPGMAQGATLSSNDPSTTIGAPQNEAWFRFDVTGTADSGALQTITLTGDGLPAELGFAAGIVGFTNTAGAPPLTEATNLGVFTATGPAGDGASGFLVLSQQAPGPFKVPVKALFDTDLRHLSVGNLVCEDETNPEFGSDDLYSVIEADGIATRHPGGSGYVEFDCDDSDDTEPWAPQVGKAQIRYVTGFRMRLADLDDASADDGSPWAAPDDLAPTDSAAVGRYLWWEFDGGRYRFHFDLRKRPNDTVK